MRTCSEILIAAGLAPRDVAIFGLTEDGYMEFQRDSFGAVRVTDGQPVMAARPWPEGFPVQEFFAAYRTNYGDNQ